ncbi:MAG: VOC family protein [Pseudomonadota bacterium]
MQAGSVLETVLYAEDLDAAERFYGEVLGLDCLHRHATRQVFFRCGQGMVLIFNPAETASPPLDPALPVPPHGAHGAGHLCFRATRAEQAAWRDHLQGHGIEIEAEMEWPQGGHSLYFRDPAGNSLEFAEPQIWRLG